jgi:hypothetical protein
MDTPQILDENNLISDISIDLKLSYADGSNTNVASRIVEVRVWNILSGTQQQNLQDIQTTIDQYIQGIYFT